MKNDVKKLQKQLKIQWIVIVVLLLGLAGNAFYTWSFQESNETVDADLGQMIFQLRLDQQNQHQHN